MHVGRRGLENTSDVAGLVVAVTSNPLRDETSTATAETLEEKLVETSHFLLAGHNTLFECQRRSRYLEDFERQLIRLQVTLLTDFESRPWTNITSDLLIKMV